METLYKEYAEIKQRQKELSDQEDFLKKTILAELDKNKIDKVETQFGKFTVAKRKNWIYSERVDALKESVKLAEIEEQEKNIAKVKLTTYLMFKEN